MSVESAVRAGRAAAERRMLTRCAIQYVTGRTTQDPDTGSEAPVYETAFETKCRVKSTSRAVRDPEAGGRNAAEVTRELDIPISSADPWADARSVRGVTALITAVHSTDDPTLLGARLALSGAAPGSQTTVRRLEVTEVVT